MRVFGRIDALDRANQKVRATIDGISDIECEANWSRPLWPLSRAQFEYLGTGQWYCLGSVGHRRVLFHDDFTHVAAASGYGDTMWTFGSALGGGAVTAAPGRGLGAIAVTANATGGPITASEAYLQKDASSLVAPAPPLGLLVTVRAASASPFTAAGGAGVYLRDLATGHYVGGGLDSGSLVDGLYVGGRGSAGSDVTVVDGARPSADEFFFAELLYVSGAFVAYWAHGNGPAVIDQPENLPAEGASLTLRVSSSNGASSPDNTIYVDLVAFDKVQVAGVVP